MRQLCNHSHFKTLSATNQSLWNASFLTLTTRHTNCAALTWVHQICSYFASPRRCDWSQPPAVPYNTKRYPWKTTECGALFSSIGFSTTKETICSVIHRHGGHLQSSFFAARFVLLENLILQRRLVIPHFRVSSQIPSTRSSKSPASVDHALKARLLHG